MLHKQADMASICQSFKVIDKLLMDLINPISNNLYHSGWIHKKWQKESES